MHLHIESQAQFEHWCPPGPVLVFAQTSSDVQEALLAPLAQHSARGDRLDLLTVDSCDHAPPLANLHCEPFSIPADRLDEAACQRIADLIEQRRPTRVYVPACEEGHEYPALHVWEGVRRARHRVELALGELASPLPETTVWIDSPLPIPKNDEAAFYLRRFRSSAAQRPNAHGNAILLIDPKDRALPGQSGVKHGVSPQDSTDQPLVTVIVRTAGRETLPQALDSVATQTWPALELVLVNIREDALPFDVGTDWKGVPARIVHRPLANRSEAANAGLEAVASPFFLFLDDDDRLYPAHVAHLVAALQTYPDRRLAYGGIRIEHCDRDGRLQEVRLLDEPFSLQRLRLGNYIPIHACLIRRDVIDSGIRFDPALNHYEDWDFFLQIAERSPFVHRPGTIGVYHVRNDSEVSAQSPTAVYARWLERTGPGALAEIAHWALSDQTPAAASLRRELGALRRELGALRDELAELRRGREGDQQALAHAELRIAELQDLLSHAHERLSLTLKELQTVQAESDRKSQWLGEREREVAGARHELSTVYASTSWRLTYPARLIVTAIRTLLSAIASLRLLIRSHGGGFKGLQQVMVRALRGARRYGLLITFRRGHQILMGPQTNPAPDITATPRLERPPVGPATEPVDIVICVHNALDDVRNCLASVSAQTSGDYRLIIVDDGSEAPTRDFLADYARGHDVRLIRHEQATGYTRAANAGLKAGTAPNVVLLNSDTIVGPEWIDRLYTCLHSSPTLAMVGPLSNCASWQSIPEIEDAAGGDWATNPLPEGLTPALMAERVAADSSRIYPRLSFLNGFCQMIRRSALNGVGLLDEAGFPMGYGEENDLCVRLRQAGWELAVADDVWVYHAQSKSYSSERRIKLCTAAAETLARKHGAHTIESGARQCRDDLALKGIRARNRYLHERLACIESGRARHSGRRLLFLLPTGDAGGGANVIVTESRALQRMGVDVALANFAMNQTLFESNYGDCGIPVHYFRHPDDILDLGRDFDAVIASIYYSVDWLIPLAKLDRPPVLGYYVQDFEPSFFNPSSPDYREALKSYVKLPDLVRFCKTHWNRRAVLEATGADCTVIGPSLDVDRFRPWPRTTREPTRIAAMVRPNSPYRSPALTMDILGDIATECGSEVEILTFGVDANESAFQELRRDFPFKHLGKLSPAQLAVVLSDCDIFADFSTHQAMGLTALEAMASHCAVILPRQGGTSDIAADGQSALFIDAGDPAGCRDALRRLVKDASLRRRLADRALDEVNRFYPERAARRLLDALFDMRPALSDE